MSINMETRLCTWSLGFTGYLHKIVGQECEDAIFALLPRFQELQLTYLESLMLTNIAILTPGL